MRASACSILAIALLSACAEPADTAKETELVKTDAPAETSAILGDPVAEIISQNSGTLKLGAKIVGPVGPEVQASLSTDLGAIGDIESYVACPEDMDVCDPKTAPAGTIFTYVHKVTPGEDEPNDPPFAQPEAVIPVKSAMGFKIAGPVNGFNGVAGYAMDEAKAALGEEAFISVQCKDDGLAFTVELGDKWNSGEAITFFWQSTIPPKGPGGGFTLIADDQEGTGQGPVAGPSDETPSAAQASCS